MTDAHSYSMHIPSERSNIAAVESFVMSIPEARQLTRERFHDLLLALTEAVNNAIIHGNQCDSSKMVEVDVRAQDSEMVFLVRDYGHGFDANALPDPRQPENLLREGGRGVFLIRNLADVVEFYPANPGTVVLLKYFL